MAGIPRLTSLSHGGGCGCKIAPGVLAEILKGSAALPTPPESVASVLTLFERLGFAAAAEIGEVRQGGAAPLVLQ